MSGAPKNHFNRSQRDDKRHHWRGGPTTSAVDVTSSKDVMKHLNAAHEFAQRCHHVDLLVKVTKAEIELTRIRIAEKLESIHNKEYVYRKC